MRYLPMIVAAGLLSAGLLAGSGPANAVPTLAFDRSAVEADLSTSTPVETWCPVVGHT